ncbi:probable methyltransferase TARBP1 [Manduca sexta]|uniref:tRNA (guanosine(18)-2'-O)-methyltransferase TARBP1 n=1 Tax=Manduca sexta TaxID=7130 RepID=A0A922CVU6_MANSE|nr:probable methyltransferase TARBP1 [Manduca sexta]KAG6460204.1 hypothetical protein O3G_MSEX011836 [Manduca sexta]KAG6460205.1 hypothetical protein O3G_MSEX011836 [Manduca sexta]
MGSNEEQLTFLDLLDVDEELIDTRLKSIMERNSYTEKHLKNALLLLQYKHLINKREDSECDNQAECNFIAKLMSNIQEENVNIVSDIIKVVLSLNVSTIISKSEHLIQQILSSIDLPHINDIEKDSITKILLELKICDSILDAVVGHGGKITLYFMETPLVNILSYPDEKLKVHFLTHTVPKFYVSVVGYNILDRIWDYMRDLENDHREKALRILCCLSQYYLPINDDECNVKTYSEIIYKTEFWKIILYGLNSQDASVRKTAIYLAKRAIDHVGEIKKDVTVKEKDNIFMWQQKNSQNLKLEWDNFFILIESLEEKQSNIVLPSLQLFDYLNNFEKCWLMCAFNIGLKHDNALVRLKCIEYRLNFYFDSTSEVVSVLEAFNDINLLDNKKETELLEAKINRAIIEKDCILNIIKAIPEVKWSPVPLYSLSNVLSNLKVNNLTMNIEDHEFESLMKSILKVPCNNIIIRKAIHLNISLFVGNCCKGFNWKTFLHIYPFFQNKFDDENPFIELITNINFTDEEERHFFKFMAESQSYVDFCLLYLNSHENISLFIDVVNEVLKKIRHVVDRQYCNKLECIKDVSFIMHLLGETNKNKTITNKVLNEVIQRDFKILCQYILCLFSNDAAATIADMELIFAADNFLINPNDELCEIFLVLYKTSTIFLMDKEADIDKRVLSMFIINNIIWNNRHDSFMHKHDKLNIEKVMSWSNELPTQNIESVGRVKSKFHEESCKLIHTLLKEEETFKDEDLLNFVEKVLDCGGYGCLKWILKIIHIILSRILSNKKFNMPQFLNRTWQEIEELKSNNQYTICIQGFVDILTHDVVLERAEYNNVVVSYCSKIIEYAAVKNMPLYYLITKLNEKKCLKPHLICILCEILLYSPVQRKDQRIMDSTEIHILNNAKYGWETQIINSHYDFQIQYVSLATLSKIKDTETLKIILQLIKTRMDILFRNKVRYHGNSQTHRTFLAALQHFLFGLLLNVESRSQDLFIWCVEMLGKLPHQPSVRICLEWYITLYLYLEKQTINEKLLQTLKAKNVPLSSQFIVIYWSLKHKLLRKVYTPNEFDFVMDTLLSHTMGQIFNIRLLAQYLSNNLYALNKNGSAKYVTTIEIIGRTFAQSCKDKNFCKLQNDYFVNNFNIVGNFTPYFIYEMISKYSEVGNNDERDLHYIKNVLKDIDEALREVSDFKEEWLELRLSDDCYDVKVSEVAEKNLEDVETVCTIQKKYIPWRNMSEVNCYDVGKKRESGSQLIVVASLIDKLPNLGGMARTCEVFGVKKYIVDSLRHLADKQFQGLSVSAERWVDVEEVRPGRALKEYLTRMKAEGYSVVAAEQTSTSCKLQSFRFPKKTLLLLGHEKEGVPCDLLPMMDHCVEIPQQGFVRSLNVHVTAAIFVWEYARQNIL